MVGSQWRPQGMPHLLHCGHIPRGSLDCCQEGADALLARQSCLLSLRDNRGCTGKSQTYYFMPLPLCAREETGRREGRPGGGPAMVLCGQELVGGWVLELTAAAAAWATRLLTAVPMLNLSRSAAASERAALARFSIVFVYSFTCSSNAKTHALALQARIPTHSGAVPHSGMAKRTEHCC